MRWRIALSLGLCLQLAAASRAGAQTAADAWLRYLPPPEAPRTPGQVVAVGGGPIERSAAAELERALGSLRSGSGPSPGAGSVVLGTSAELRGRYPDLPPLAPGEFLITARQAPSGAEIAIAGGDERGVLYGAFALLRHLGQGEDPKGLRLHERPRLALRWVDQWDNLDGSIERGYAGRSIFFEGGHVREDLGAAAEYARLLASVGVNGCNVNNVNNAASILEPEMIRGLARIADRMRPWGVRLAISVDVASPRRVGGLPTYDPLDPAVVEWWNRKVGEIYAAIPDFAGFTVKADSEGQPGPASYGRTPADAANTLARALAPHGGVVLYRAFVYNHHLDWTDPRADRARAAYDIFHPLDGSFAPNVVIQIKEGPIDFQVREPVSPLFGGLRRTSQAMELQITQEYLGQQRHLVYLAPMWRWVLDTDFGIDDRPSPVSELISGARFEQPLGGMVGVANVGQDHWLGSPLALANLYAFGRLAWDPGLAPEAIAREWTMQTIGSDPRVVETVGAMLAASWPAYESYTGPLGLQTLTDITGSHYGPGIEGSEHNGWGQWHRADHTGVGMDRSVATGTGFAGQYPPRLARIYESPGTTPDELLLFFHHVPYTWRLHSGKTVIQHLYDSHYEGAAETARFVREWESLKGDVDPALWENVHARLEYQAGHAVVWRDAVVQYFLRLSGVPDARGRAGKYPGRLEAEDARLNGYQTVDVNPWEDASMGRAVSCQQTAACRAEWSWTGAPGRYDLAVQYFDLQGGVAHFTLEVNGRSLASWAADQTLPSRRLHGDNSTRHTVRGPDGGGIALEPGDRIAIAGTPDGADPAAIDYIELKPAGE